MYKEDIECVCFCMLDRVHVGTFGCASVCQCEFMCVCVFVYIMGGQKTARVRDNVKDMCEYVCNVLILHPAGHGTSPKDVFIMMVKHLSPERCAVTKLQLLA